MEAHAHALYGVLKLDVMALKNFQFNSALKEVYKMGAHSLLLRFNMPVFEFMLGRNAPSHLYMQHQNAY